MSNYIHHEMLDEIIYPFSKLWNGGIISSHLLQGICLHFHAVIELEPCKLKGLQGSQGA